MRGRASFRLNELHAIEHALTQIERCDRGGRRRLQGMLRRRYRFYVSDFARGGAGLSAADAERLIAQGVISVR